MKKEKVYAFIDSQNIYMGVLSKGWKLDWGKLRLHLRNKYGVVKAYLFIGYIRQNIQLYEYLQNIGYVLIFKDVLAIHHGDKVTYKGNIDAELVLHSMIQYPNYSKAMIASGDGDFLCLIEYLEEKGKLLKIIVPNKTFSSFLRKYSPYIVDLYTKRKKLEKKREAFPR